MFQNPVPNELRHAGTAGFYHRLMVATLVACKMKWLWMISANKEAAPDYFALMEYITLHLKAIIYYKHFVLFCPLGPDRNICNGTSLQLNPGSVSTYQWQDNSVSGSFTVTGAGRYWVRVTNGSNCMAADTVKILSILQGPGNFLKATDSVCQYETIKLSFVGNFLNYQWSTGSIQLIVPVSQPGSIYIDSTGTKWVLWS